jgi:putative glutathione S-transferase
MGMLVEGRWRAEDRIFEDGGFRRQASLFDAPLGPELAESLRGDPGRYCLIASLSCPWSHRALIARALKGLEDTVSLQIAGGRRVEGYAVNGGAFWNVPGGDRRIVHLHELYSLSNPSYSGRCTVPLLWDSLRQRIVCNESARIVRLFDQAPAVSGHLDFTLRPPHLAGEIDVLNKRLHDELSNAVYRAGLARRQDLYEAAVGEVFAMLDELEARLEERRYLFGSVLTESDLMLLPTLLRFDSVYHGHFRCSRRRLVDYPHLWAYARDLFAWCGIAATTDFRIIREGYYLNDGDGNPFGIVAVAPDANWFLPHGRGRLSAAKVAMRDGTMVEVEPATLTPVGEG